MHKYTHTHSVLFITLAEWASIALFGSSKCLPVLTVSTAKQSIWMRTCGKLLKGITLYLATPTGTHTYTVKQSNRYLCTHSEAFEQLWLSLCLRVLNCLWVIANHEQFALTSSIVVAVPVVEVWLFISLTFTPTWTLGRWYVPLPCRQVPIYDFDFSLVLHFTNGLCFDFLRPYACVSFVLHLQRLLSKCICLPQCVFRLSKRVCAFVCACICA